MVAASGSGTNFQALIDAVLRKQLRVRFGGLIAGSATIGAVERAERNGIPVYVLPPSKGNASDTGSMLAVLKSLQPDLIVLAGWLRKIPVDVIAAYPEAIVNIHPSLLPKFGGKGFYGLRVHEAVLAAGEKESGCTVHLVNEEYDQGRILGQRRVAVEPGDTPQSLAARVLEQEHQLYPACIGELLQDRTTTDYQK